MDPSTQRKYHHGSQSPSYSNNPTEPEHINSPFPSGSNIRVDSYGNKSPPTQATIYDPLITPVTITDVECLLENSRALISDFSILNGEFASSSSSPSSIAILNSCPHDLSNLCDFESRVSRLFNKVRTRETTDPVTRSATHSETEAEDQRAKLASEHEKLEDLYGSYTGMRDDIEKLRCRLEKENKGQYGVYDYELEINYQVIGNQVLPPYNRKARKGPKKRAATLESGPAPSEAESMPVPAAKKARVGKVKAKGEKVKNGSGGGVENASEEDVKEGKGMDKHQRKNIDMEDLQAELERMKKERALLAIEVNALKAEKKILQS